MIDAAQGTLPDLEAPVARVRSGVARRLNPAHGGVRERGASGPQRSARGTGRGYRARAAAARGTESRKPPLAAFADRCGVLAGLASAAPIRNGGRSPGFLSYQTISVRKICSQHAYIGRSGAVVIRGPVNASLAADEGELTDVSVGASRRWSPSSPVRSQRLSPSTTVGGATACLPGGPRR